MAQGMLTIREVGRIREVKKDVARVAGLPRCMVGQLLEIGKRARGLVIGFVRGEALVFLLGVPETVAPGTEVRARLETFAVPVGHGFLGRVVNALGEPLDGKGAVRESAREPVFRDAAGVLDRIPLAENFATGVLVLDTAIPIAKGQRELILGNRMTGKTALAVDTILNQQGKGVICIYCAIGQPYSALERVLETLNLSRALAHTVVVAATAGSPSGEQYIAPYAACALGEYFMHGGHDVFVTFDDLTKHAWAYRQLSLLLERAPGRDAYPGDIFYLHSQLMERAGKLKPELGGGSMTFFPIAETQEGEIAGYIPSNLVSMTDGQIFLDSALFAAGGKPAVDLGLSVSRIGNKVQFPALRELGGKVRLEYLQYNELLKLTRFRTGTTEDSAKQLRRGEIMTALFQQEVNRPRPLAEQLLLLYALQRGVLEELAQDEIRAFKQTAAEYFVREHPEPYRELGTGNAITPELARCLDRGLLAFFKRER